MSPTVMTVVGARPQFIKAAPVSRALDGRATEHIVNTGQHYDEAMSGRFFSELRIPDPSHDLGIGSGSHGKQTGSMLAALESVMVDMSPDIVQVYGDTNSTLAGALAAAKLGIPVAHVEAGLRSWRREMPEEVNRVLTDHVSALLLCPTNTARDNLASEGITSGVHVVGDVMVDAVHMAIPHLSPHRLARYSLPDRYIAATMHRPSNVDSWEQLTAALALFAAMPHPVAIALHPRTEASMRTHDLRWPDNVIVLEPLGYLDMLSLARYSAAMLTDSGGLQKEAIIVGTPCVVMRTETEWVETVEAGLSTLVGLDAMAAVAAVESAKRPTQDAIDDLFAPGASRRVAEHLVALGTS